MKKVLSIIFAVIMLFTALPFHGHAAENANVSQGNSVTCTNLVLFEDYFMITAEGSNQKVLPGSASPCGFTTKTYTYIIYNRNGSYIDTLTTTVIGSATDSQEFHIVFLSGNCSNYGISGMSHTVEYSGSTATVYITLKGATICSLGYMISADGAISQQ